MILTYSEIKKEIEKGNISISDFDESRLNPNSYNLRLSNKLKVYTDDIIDMKKENNFETIIIPEEGYVLEPGKVYIGSTVEFTKVKGNIVPFLEGRSSTGRLGLFAEVSAGVGDVGFEGNWTLELIVAQPLRVYPNVEVCQIIYHRADGDTSHTYTGKYQGQTEPETSKMFKDFTKEENTKSTDELKKNLTSEFNKLVSEHDTFLIDKELLLIKLFADIGIGVNRSLKVIDVIISHLDEKSKMNFIDTLIYIIKTKLCSKINLLTFYSILKSTYNEIKSNGTCTGENIKIIKDDSPCSELSSLLEIIPDCEEDFNVELKKVCLILTLLSSTVTSDSVNIYDLLYIFNHVEYYMSNTEKMTMYDNMFDKIRYCDTEINLDFILDNILEEYKSISDNKMLKNGLLDLIRLRNAYNYKLCSYEQLITLKGILLSIYNNTTPLFPLPSYEEKNDELEAECYMKIIDYDLNKLDLLYDNYIKYVLEHVINYIEKDNSKYHTVTIIGSLSLNEDIIKALIK